MSSLRSMKCTAVTMNNVDVGASVWFCHIKSDQFFDATLLYLCRKCQPIHLRKQVSKHVPSGPDITDRAWVSLPDLRVSIDLCCQIFSTPLASFTHVPARILVMFEGGFEAACFVFLFPSTESFQICERLRAHWWIH